MNEIKIFDDLREEIFKDMEQEDRFIEETYKKPKEMKETIIRTGLKAILMKLLKNLKITLIVEWKNNELFRYTFPKN